MATATALPKRSEVRVEDTWNLEAIYPSVEAWEADFQRVTGMGNSRFKALDEQPVSGAGGPRHDARE